MKSQEMTGNSEGYFGEIQRTNLIHRTQA